MPTPGELDDLVRRSAADLRIEGVSGFTTLNELRDFLQQERAFWSKNAPNFGAIRIPLEAAANALSDVERSGIGMAAREAVIRAIQELKTPSGEGVVFSGSPFAKLLVHLAGENAMRAEGAYTYRNGVLSGGLLNQRAALGVCRR